MATIDPFDDLLELEDNFYQQGYKDGLADGEYAGLVEGKTFGIEKGYEKALELGCLHGRALIWQARAQMAQNEAGIGSAQATEGETVLMSLAQPGTLPKNSRLVKHIEGLLSITDPSTVSTDNSDQAVSDFDERLARAQAKAKVIAAIIGEPLRTEDSVGDGIEESTGLNARH